MIIRIQILIYSGTFRTKLKSWRSWWRNAITTSRSGSWSHSSSEATTSVDTAITRYVGAVDVRRHVTIGNSREVFHWRFVSSPSYSHEKCVLQISHFLWEFQAENLCVCPKPCFGHTYKISAWNYYHKSDFGHCIFSQNYIGELAKH